MSISLANTNSADDSSALFVLAREIHSTGYVYC